MPDFSRQHYERIADALNTVVTLPDTWPYGGHEAIACRLADMFGADNPQFDRVRFLLACGLDLPKHVEQQALTQEALDAE